MGSISTPYYWAFSSSSRNSSRFLTSSLLSLSAFIPPSQLYFLRRNLKHDNTVSSLLYLRRNDKRRGRVINSSQVRVETVEDDEACELVSRVELCIGDGDDDNTIAAYLCKAVKNNNGIGILLLSDFFGFQDSATGDFAYRLACNGYNVLVPDLFRGDPWTKERPKELFEEWVATQYPERVVGDIFTCANWLANESAEEGVSSKKLGVIGFGFGGGHVINILSQDKGHLFATGVSFYGTRIDTCSTLFSSSLGGVSVPSVLLILGDHDHLCTPVEELKALEKEIKGCKVIVFKGRGHGFAHRPESLDEDEDAEAAFVIMRNWLHDALTVNVDT